MNNISFKNIIINEIEKYISNNSNDKELLKIKNFVEYRNDENRKAYIRIHDGLGDMINMIGAIRYLFHFYNELLLSCYDKDLENAKILFKDLDDIKFVNDFINIEKFKSLGYDIFDATHTNGIYGNVRKISTNNFFLKMDKKINNSHVRHFIENFYTYLNLDIKIYTEFFYIPIIDTSLNLFSYIDKYNIIFIHENTSKRNHDFSHLIDINNKDEIIICANRNYYDEKNEKYKLAQKFVNIPILLYVDTLINSKKIIITDSCFSSIILPLCIKNVCKCEDITIYRRNWHNYIEDLYPKIKTYII
jgi:hypothetical protein